MLLSNPPIRCFLAEAEWTALCIWLPGVVKLGQGGFRILVTEAYHRRCAITGEKTLPVLDASHIKPYGKDGPHRTSNGLLLRQDMHNLFDRGYMTIDEDYKIIVSR